MTEQNVMGDIDFASWVAEVSRELPTDYGANNELARWGYLDRTVMASEAASREEDQQLPNAEVVFYPSGYREMPRRKEYSLTRTDASAAAQDIRNFLKRGDFPNVTIR
jgi:hypothetical protein